MKVLPSPGNGAGHENHVVPRGGSAFTACNRVQQGPLDSSDLILGLVGHVRRGQSAVRRETRCVKLHDLLQVAATLVTSRRRHERVAVLSALVAESEISGTKGAGAWEGSVATEISNRSRLCRLLRLMQGPFNDTH